MWHNSVQLATDEPLVATAAAFCTAAPAEARPLTPANILLARHARRALIIQMVAAVATVVMAVEEATAGARCLAYGFGAARALDQMRHLVPKLVEEFSVGHPI
eukprot:jgi/Tetstr1/459483/TSEL_004850.t1